MTSNTKSNYTCMVSDHNLMKFHVRKEKLDGKSAKKNDIKDTI